MVQSLNMMIWGKLLHFWRYDIFYETIKYSCLQKTSIDFCFCEDTNYTFTFISYFKSCSAVTLQGKDKQCLNIVNEIKSMPKCEWQKIYHLLILISITSQLSHSISSRCQTKYNPGLWETYVSLHCQWSKAIKYTYSQSFFFVPSYLYFLFLCLSLFQNIANFLTPLT